MLTRCKGYYVNIPTMTKQTSVLIFAKKKLELPPIKVKLHFHVKLRSFQLILYYIFIGNSKKKYRRADLDEGTVVCVYVRIGWRYLHENDFMFYSFFSYNSDSVTLIWTYVIDL